MARRHHISVWLLKQFTPKAPWVYDTTTGEIVDLGFKKVGQVPDAWSKEMEDSIMTPHDTRAGDIFHNRIESRQRIRLSDTERIDFAKWLCLFAYRVPDAREFAEREWGKIKADPEKLAVLFSDDRVQLIRTIQEDYPEYYREVIETNGKVEGERLLFTELMAVASERGDTLLAPPQNVWHYNIQKATLETDADYLSGCNWTWWYCRHGLVIGDNPLARWHPKENRSYRLVNRGGVEITFPLGANLCLQIQNARRDENGQRRIATRAQCEEFNRRQWQCCSQFVYAGERELLDRIEARIKRPGGPFVPGKRLPNAADLLVGG